MLEEDFTGYEFSGKKLFCEPETFSALLKDLNYTVSKSAIFLNDPVVRIINYFFLILKTANKYPQFKTDRKTAMRGIKRAINCFEYLINWYRTMDFELRAQLINAASLDDELILCFINEVMNSAPIVGTKTTTFSLYSSLHEPMMIALLKSAKTQEESLKNKTSPISFKRGPHYERLRYVIIVIGCLIYDWFQHWEELQSKKQTSRKREKFIRNFFEVCKNELNANIVIPKPSEEFKRLLIKPIVDKPSKPTEAEVKQFCKGVLHLIIGIKVTTSDLPDLSKIWHDLETLCSEI